MSGVGFWELVILFLIGLIVLGPERLPRVANQLGTWLGQARRMTRVMKRQLEEELNFEKDVSIKPPGREPSTRPAYTPPSTQSSTQPAYKPPRDDDQYSAAHAKGEPGTGIADGKGQGADDELAVAKADAGEPPLAGKKKPRAAKSGASKKKKTAKAAK